MEITASGCPESQSRLCGYGTNCTALLESLYFCLEEALQVVAARVTAVLCFIYLNGDTEGCGAWEVVVVYKTRLALMPPVMPLCGFSC